MTKVSKEVEKIQKDLISGGVGVMPTDTIYGLVGSVLSEQVVERIYQIKNRDTDKPCIVLISAPDELERFNINPGKRLTKVLEGLWPGPVSVIVPCDSERHGYVHRGKSSIAFRVPEPEWLRELLTNTGPLVAPSANISGEPPAKNIVEAKDYFGDKVDFYLDKGELHGRPSVLLEVKRF